MGYSYERHTPSRAEAVVGMAGDAIRRWLDRRELGHFMRDYPAEAERMARDLNTDKESLLQVAGRRTPLLLNRRLKALRIDSEKLGKTEPAVLRDLTRCCSLCECKSRCARDLALAPDKATWQSYCPNTYTLKALAPRPAVPQVLSYL